MKFTSVCSRCRHVLRSRDLVKFCSAGWSQTSILTSMHCVRTSMHHVKWNAPNNITSCSFIDITSCSSYLLRYVEPQWQLLTVNNSANVSELQTEECVDGWTFDRSEFLATTVSEVTDPSVSLSLSLWTFPSESVSLSLNLSVWICLCLSGTWCVRCVLWSRWFRPSIWAEFWQEQSSLAACRTGGIYLWKHEPVSRTCVSVSKNLSVSLTLRFGRRSILIWSYLQLGVLGCCSALSPSYTTYCIFRFLSGMAVSGIILNGVSLSTCLSLYLSVCLSSYWSVLIFLMMWSSVRVLQRWSGFRPKRGHSLGRSHHSSSPLVKWSWRDSLIGWETGGSCRSSSVRHTFCSSPTVGQWRLSALDWSGGSYISALWLVRWFLHVCSLIGQVVLRVSPLVGSEPAVWGGVEEFTQSRSN